MKVGMSEQIFCEVVTSPSRDYIIGMDVISDWYCKTEGI